jgi:hypothetical protein
MRGEETVNWKEVSTEPAPGLCQTISSHRSTLEPPSGREDPSFTMSIARPGVSRAGETLNDREFGGARRDRTDDLMLAKHALYQLSYGPIGSERP